MIKTSKPKVFANKVISQMIQHMVSEDMIVNNKDYQALRSVFRKCGGSWEALVDGNQVHIELLKKIVSEWGKMPGRKKKSDQLI
jgi:hypothetical protein